MSACCDSFLTSVASSDKSTPQKLLCGCRDSRPACISFGASCLIHAIRNFALFDPALQDYVRSRQQFGPQGAQTCPVLSDVNGMSQVRHRVD